MRALKRGFLTYPSRIEAINKAKRPGNKYECNCCHRLFSRTGIECDHIVPVGSFDNWTSYISRLFVPSDKLQILCIPCHQKKTKTQNSQKRSVDKWAQREVSLTMVDLSRWERKSLEFAENFD